MYASHYTMERRRPMSRNSTGSSPLHTDMSETNSPGHPSSMDSLSPGPADFSVFRFHESCSDSHIDSRRPTPMLHSFSSIDMHCTKNYGPQGDLCFSMLKSEDGSSPCSSFSHDTELSGRVAETTVDARKIHVEDLEDPDTIMQHTQYMNSNHVDMDASDNDADMLEKSTTPYTDVTKPRKAPKNDHVRRPMNAFMLFATKMRNDLRASNPNLHNAQISKYSAKIWKGLEENKKQEWKNKAEELKELHKLQYPDYKYRPRKNKKAKASEVTTESGRISKPTSKAQDAKPRASRSRKSGTSSRSKKAQNTEQLPPSPSSVSDTYDAPIYAPSLSVDCDHLDLSVPEPMPTRTLVIDAVAQPSLAHLQQHFKISGGIVVAELASISRLHSLPDQTPQQDTELPDPTILGHINMSDYLSGLNTADALEFEPMSDVHNQLLQVKIEKPEPAVQFNLLNVLKYEPNNDVHNHQLLQVKIEQPEPTVQLNLLNLLNNDFTMLGPVSEYPPEDIFE